MSRLDSEISTNGCPFKERGARLRRLVCVGLLAVAVASPTATRLWQKHDVACLVGQYRSLVEQGYYQEAKWVASLAMESYPDSSITKYMAVQSETLLRLADAFWDFDEDDDDPFSASAFDFSNQDS